ncbi:hypothetical protein E3N88_44484 [Mikania micrantha]|uniref:Uncharacterized protein n=1 Tax=Mikania micrantha TaxID=192012 RepID=A0A5N6LBW2_9ASTR|nr:hypothetical protein E3N88_44484 [Mikania micrantha]
MGAKVRKTPCQHASRWPSHVPFRQDVVPSAPTGQITRNRAEAAQDAPNIGNKATERVPRLPQAKITRNHAQAAQRAAINESSACRMGAGVCQTPCQRAMRWAVHVPLAQEWPLLLVGKQATGTRVASSPDSDLEAFSHNPAHGSFAPLAFQPSAMTNCANQRFLSY